MSQIEHFRVCFLLNIELKDRAIKKFKPSPKIHLLQFFNEKPFSQHSFGVKFLVKVD